MIRKINGRPLFCALITFILLFLVSIPWIGCSLIKGKEAKAQQVVKEEQPEKVAAVEVFKPVTEQTLGWIRGLYSTEGIRIKSIEVALHPKEKARIELDYPAHSEHQKALAGLFVLWDNFPRIGLYTALIDDKQFDTTYQAVEFMVENGYTFQTDASQASELWRVMKEKFPITE